ncbi:MAG: ABC transporter permease [Candidatus Edwardsbacteria bacterium]
MTIQQNLEAIKQEIKKNILIWLCYPVEIIFWAIFPLLWVIPFLFQGIALVGGLMSQSFKGLTGTGQYIPFVLIGAVVSSYVFSSLYGMGGSLRVESYWGTLELILGSPTNRLTILLGKALSESIMATFFAISQAAVCVVLFGLKLTLGKIMPTLLVMVLTVTGLYGLGIALAGITLQIKESRSLAHTLENVFMLCSPVRYPVEISPILKIISWAIPLTYALVVIRGLMLLNRSVIELWENVVILAGIDLFFIAFGVFVFYGMERKVRRSGVVSEY